MLIHKINKLIFLFISFIIINFPLFSYGGEIIVTSKQLVIDEKLQKAVFEGDVIVKYNNDLEIISNKVMINYKTQRANEKDLNTRNIQNIIIGSKLKKDGGVKLITANGEANSDFGFFDLKGRQIILSGNVSLNSNNNQLEGQELIYYIDAKNFKMTNSPSLDEDQGLVIRRPKAVFTISK